MIAAVRSAEVQIALDTLNRESQCAQVIGEVIARVSGLTHYNSDSGITESSAIHAATKRVTFPMGNQQCCVVVLISGNGNNLQALIDASSSSGYTISHVISNNPDAFGLERAQRGISGTVMNHRDFGTRGEFDSALQQAIDDQSPDLVVLAGFMRIQFRIVKNFSGRMLNITQACYPNIPESIPINGPSMPVIVSTAPLFIS